MPEQTVPADESAAAVATTSVDVAKTVSDVVEQTVTDVVRETVTETNPHSDLPAVPDISAEIPAVEVPPEERPLPFGVYRGTPAPSPSE